MTADEAARVDWLLVRGVGSDLTQSLDLLREIEPWSVLPYLTPTRELNEFRIDCLARLRLRELLIDYYRTTSALRCSP